VDNAEISDEKSDQASAATITDFRPGFQSISQ